jgi:GT2 family glycosyltransferase
VVLVDNASHDNWLDEFAVEFPWCHCIRNLKNEGWAGGNNTGIRHALAQKAEWVVLLNNDTVVAPEFLDRLRMAAESHPDHGILGPVIGYIEEPWAVMTDGCRFNPTAYPGFFKRLEVPVERQDPPRVVDVDIVNGCCIVVAASVFEKIGLIDERFFLIHEESDLCLRARRVGFACGVLAEQLIWHKGSSSFQREGRSLQRYYDTRNLLLLLCKHARSHGRRGILSSWAWYARHAYHRYAIERELGHGSAADAVLRGLGDALAGRFGQAPETIVTSPSWLSYLFGLVFIARHRHCD